MSEVDKEKQKPKRSETEEERRVRKEREHAEKKARRAAAENAEKQKEGGDDAKKAERRKETEEERKVRKERERAERKAAEKAAAAAAEGPAPVTEKRKETEEERKIRKERERAERKAAEKAAAAAAEGTAPAKEKRKETEEERKVRKERERAERKAAEKAAGKGEKDAVDAEKAAPQQPQEKHHHHRQHSASPEAAREPKASLSAKDTERAELLKALEEENRAASRSALQSREKDASRARQETREEDKESAERREQRKREQREERRQKRLKEGRSPSEAGCENSQRDDGVAAELRRQGYRGQFEKDLARATALRRLVDLDDAAAVLVDIAPQTEYDLYIRNFTESGRKLAAVQAPDEESRVDVAVQAERVKTKNRFGQVPDDLGLYPEQYEERARFGVGGLGAGAEGESAGTNDRDSPAPTEEAKTGATGGGTGVPSVDANLLGAFLSRVFPVVGAVLDENFADAEAAGGGGDGSSALAAAARDKAKAVSTAAQSFSSACTTYTFKPVSNRAVLKTRFSPTSARFVAALYGSPSGAASEAGAKQSSAPSSSSSSAVSLDQYASVILLWNTFNSTTPERVLASFARLTCMCFSPVSPHLVYAGAEDGSVCLWDLREPDRHHIAAGRVGSHHIVVRLPSFATSWQTDNHTAPVCDVSVAGSNSSSSGSGGGGGSAGLATTATGAQQLVSLDVSGQMKFWAVNDAQGRTSTISASEYGLHMFASVRLTLASTTTAVASVEQEDGEEGFGFSGIGGGGGGGISDESDEEDGGAAVQAVGSSRTYGGGDGEAALMTHAGWLRMPCTGSSAGCCLDFSPLDPSQFVVAAAGGVHHRSRFGLVAAPAVYGGPDSSPYAVPSLMVASPSAAFSTPCPTCVRCSARDSRVIIAGYGDGTVRLFLRQDATAQLVVPVSAGAAAITEVRTASATSWLAWALDEAGTLYLLDHAHRQQREVPRVVAPLSQPETGICLCMDVPPGEKALDNGQLAVGFEKGVLQVHTIDARKVLAPPADRDEKWL